MLGVGGIILARFDYVPGFDFDTDTIVVEDTAITAVPYVPEAVATCQTLQSIPDQELTPQTADRPSLTGIWDNGTDTITGSTCALDTEFGPVTFIGYTKIEIDFDLTKGAKSIDGNAFSFNNPPFTDDTCTTEDTGGLGLIEVAVEGKFLDGPVDTTTTDEAIEDFDSDWDKDGCTDWDELNPNGSRLDPFNAADCAPGVGGIAELPAVAGTSPEAAALSDSNAGLIAAAAAATAAGALALGSAAQYARRRSVR